MGKNPNAKKLKERKHRERTYSNNIEDLEEEAALEGITVLELQQRRKEQNGGESSSSDNDSDSSSEQPKKKPVKKPAAAENDSDGEEVKQVPQQKAPQMPPQSDEEADSDDDELEKLYGLGKNHKATVAKAQDSSSEEEPAPKKGV